MAEIGKLEDLLGRIARNRRAVPVGGMAQAVAVAAPPIASPPSSIPPPLSTPPLELAEPTTEERVRPPKPTPMEMALETELEGHSDMDVEITIDDGPELSIDEEGELTEAAPTAPVGLRAPEPLAADEPPAPELPLPEPLLPRPIEVAVAKPSSPVARVVSRPQRREPTTFGELLDRTLALRPR